MFWELLRLAQEKLWHFLFLYVIKFYLLFKQCGSNVTDEFLEKHSGMHRDNKECNPSNTLSEQNKK